MIGDRVKKKLFETTYPINFCTATNRLNSIEISNVTENGYVYINTHTHITIVAPLQSIGHDTRFIGFRSLHYPIVSHFFNEKPQIRLSNHAKQKDREREKKANAPHMRYNKSRKSYTSYIRKCVNYMITAFSFWPIDK